MFAESQTVWDRKPNSICNKDLEVDLHNAEDIYFSRADLLITGLRHDGPSYEARIFLNNPQADADTPTDMESGYAASFYVFGHGDCGGGTGHCDVQERKPFDFRPRHHMTPANVTVPITQQLEALRERGEKLRAITLVPVQNSERPEIFSDFADKLLRFEDAVIQTYTGGITASPNPRGPRGRGGNSPVLRPNPAASGGARPDPENTRALKRRRVDDSLTEDELNDPMDAG